MKIFSSCRIASLVLACAASSAHAVNPAPGLYFGIMGGGSYFSSISFSIYHPYTNRLTPGELTYKPMGNGGFQLGYRLEKFRFEGEFNFNSNSFDKLKLDIYRFPANKHKYGLRLRGNTAITSGMINAFYEMYTPDPDITGAVPYVGLGVGYGLVTNRVRFYRDNRLLQGSQEKQHSHAAIGQAIIGMSYFFDDFTSVAFDARYFSTTNVSSIDQRIQGASLNLLLNFSFDTPNQ